MFHAKSVIVTGAASGIGRATAIRFARDGANVIVSDIDESGADQTAETARAAGGVALVEIVDVSRRDAVDALVDRAVAEFGRLDVMVANAGVPGGKFSFVNTPEADLDRVLDVNLKGVYFCGQAAARSMISAGIRGCIINTASAYAEVCEPDCSAYCASKGAVRMLTKAMALELGAHGIRVNAVAPGVIRTGMNPLVNPERNRELESQIPLGRIGTPDDVAAAIALLASPDAAYITGELLLVDGGWIVQ